MEAKEGEGEGGYAHVRDLGEHKIQKVWGLIRQEPQTQQHHVEYFLSVLEFVPPLDVAAKLLGYQLVLALEALELLVDLLNALLLHFVVLGQQHCEDKAHDKHAQYYVYVCQIIALVLLGHAEEVPLAGSLEVV